MMINVGSITSNHDLIKSGITDSSLKKEKLPNNFIIHPVTIPAIMATNIPAPPRAE